MSSDRPKKNIKDAPDLVQYYRPVAIRSVVAAQAMIPRLRNQTALELSPTAVAALRLGFRSVSED
ncbi:hypothetical protein AC244_25395 [Ensifer adhaerens]|uniref:Uncharacterized protein n=1 Tax=Ensifer adhaerens TaxID=106592 RepID=A0A0L8BK06_ENSAD|nr:hypothetical protein AC244_25395 [Ensifer adhaerens]